MDWVLKRLKKTHFTCQQDYAQNSSRQASAVCELRTSRCTSWIQKRQEEPDTKLPTSVRSQRKQENSKKNIYLCFIDYTKAYDCVDHSKLVKIPKEMGIPDHLTCLLRNLYADQEATVRTEHRTTDWFKIGKGVHQGCILSLCLFNLNIANIRWIIKKASEFQKNIFSALLTMPKPLTMWITINCGKF